MSSNFAVTARHKKKKQPKRKPPPLSPHKQAPPAHKPPPLPAQPDLNVTGLRVMLTPKAGITPSGMFKYNPWRFQCPPMEPFTITRGHDSQEYETVYDGTFSVAAAGKLDQIQFKTLFVEDDAPWVVVGNYDIESGRDLLAELSVSGAPFHLLITHHYGLVPEYSGTVTLTDYVHTENEPYAHYSDVTFKEWRDPNVSAGTHSRPGGKTWPKHVKITAIDTLYSLAKKYYGKASMAKNIAQANHIRNTHYARAIIKLGGKWKVGAIITLPAPPPAKPNKTKPKAVKH